MEDISDGVSSLILDRGNCTRGVVYELVCYLGQHLDVSGGELGYRDVVCAPHAGQPEPARG